MKSTDRVKAWIRNGSNFEDRCRRARDFLSDPDRSKIVRTDKYSEYDVWNEPIQCEFTQDEWEQVNSIHIDDIEYDETVTPTQKKAVPRSGSQSTFRGFKVLDRKRFSSQRSLPRQVDAFLDRRADLKLDLARWMTFAFDEDLARNDRPTFFDLLSWIWRSAAASAGAGDDAHAVMRRCLAVALKNNYQPLQDHIKEDARAVGLDVSGVVPAGERPPEFLQNMKNGFEKMLDGGFPDARRAYEQAGTIAKQRGDAFGEWAAFHGEEDAALASINIFDQVKEDSQSLRDDYRRRRLAMEQATKVKEWIELAQQRRERVVQEVIDGFIEQNYRRVISGRSMSFSNYAHDYWTMFRDLETIHAPPSLQRKYVQPLIDLRGFDPDEELRYRLQLGVDESEKTERWVSRTIDDPRTSLDDQRKRDHALRKEFTRSNVFKRERLQRLNVFPGIANILHLEDMDWSLLFFSQFQEHITDGAWGHHHEYVRALCSYAALETRPIALERLEEYASGTTSRRERDELAQALRGEVSLGQWVGLHVGAAERLIRLVPDLERGSKEQEVSSSDEALAWVLFLVVCGANRFGRPLTVATNEKIRAWASRLLHKALTGEHSHLQGAFNAAARLAYLLAPDDEARGEVVRVALGRAQEGPMGVWFSLVEAGVSPTSAAMKEAANNLWAKLDETWEETLRIAKNNPQYMWPHMAFLAETIHSQLVGHLAVARERLLQLVQAAPEQLPLCAQVLDQKLWEDKWQPFVDQVWKVSSGGDGRDPVAARMGAVDLLQRWVAQPRAGSGELPTELSFLVDVTLLALLDESAVVANHAAYNVVGYASRARAPADVSRIAGALRRIAVDPRLGVRGAAAYAGKKLPLMADVADEIRAVAQAIDKAFEGDTYAVIQRQRTFGELDGKYPPY
jgi:hypothetical protein